MAEKNPASAAILSELIRCGKVTSRIEPATVGLMASDVRELIRDDIHNNPEFAAGLYQDCIDLLQPGSDEDRAAGESMLRNYFSFEEARVARMKAANNRSTTAAD